jgi:hypothetical protein
MNHNKELTLLRIDELNRERKKCLNSLFLINGLRLLGLFGWVAFYYLTKDSGHESFFVALSLPIMVFFIIMMVFFYFHETNVNNKFTQKAKAIILPEFLQIHLNDFKLLEDTEGTVPPFLEHFLSYRHKKDLKYFEKSCVEFEKIRMWDAKILQLQLGEWNGYKGYYRNSRPICALVCSLSHPHLPVTGSISCKIYDSHSKIDWCFSSNFSDPCDLKSIVSESAIKFTGSPIYNSINVTIDKDGIFLIFPGITNFPEISLLEDISLKSFEKIQWKIILIITELKLLQKKLLDILPKE